MKKLTSKQKAHNKLLKEISEIVKESERSENPNDYADPYESTWGPALGCAANAGKEHNARIPDLIKFLEGLKK